MRKIIGLFGSFVLLPAISFAQTINWEQGRSGLWDVVACSETVQECFSTNIDSQQCTTVCSKYISASNLINVITSHSARSAALESSVASVRQDLRPAIDANTAELNNLKNSVSVTELQRLIQKAVREELNQRGL